MGLLSHNCIDIKWWCLCLGHNEFGQIGNGSNNECHSLSHKMNDSMSEKFKSVSCGEYYSIALSVGSLVFCCGTRDGITSESSRKNLQNNLVKNNI